MDNAIRILKNDCRSLLEAVQWTGAMTNYEAVVTLGLLQGRATRLSGGDRWQDITSQDDDLYCLLCECKGKVDDFIGRPH